MSKKFQPPSERGALVHCHQRSGDAGIGQAIEQASPVDDGVCHQMAQEPNEKDVTRTVEQGGLATTRRAQFGLDHGHGQTKCGLVVVQSNGPRLCELLQEKRGYRTRQLDVSGD